jgi:spore coat polysaccharide biosynthesis protein SpsF
MTDRTHTMVIVQARMGSTRLPGKVMAEIAGKPMLLHVLERIQRAHLVNSILIATTCLQEDDSLCDWATRHGYPFYRGSQFDVLDRYYQAAFAGRADRIVRITSDCPLIDPVLIDQSIEIHEKTGADYVSDSVRPTLPLGESVEVFCFKSLARAWSNASLEYERVHVTPYFYRNPGKFTLESLGLSGDYRHYRWTVDTPEDLEFVKRVFAKAGNEEACLSWRDTLSIVDKNPQIKYLNEHIIQKRLEEC